MALILVKLNFVTSIWSAPVYRPFKEREECRKVRFLAALVQVFKQHQNVLIRQKIFLYALDSEIEKAGQALLSYLMR